MKAQWQIWTLILAAFISQEALATNGYYTHGLGVKNKAMAGAGTASPGDAIAIANNPAAAVLLGNRIEAGASLFTPRREYETSGSLANGQGGAFTVGPNHIESSREYFVIPHIASTWQLNENSAMGAAFYGRGGMNTDYSGGTASFDPDGPGPAPVMTLQGTFGAGTTGVDFSQAFLDIVYAKKLNSISIGIDAVLAIQSLEVTGIETFAPFTKSFAASGGAVMPKNLSNNGHDLSYGIGIKAGIIWQANEAVNLAFAYQPKIHMSDFDDYSDLFAEHGSFDIPSSLRAGISWRTNKSTMVHFDIEHIWFSEVHSVGNAMKNLFACPTAGTGGTDIESCLGGSRGAGFGWNEMTVFKLGTEWNLRSSPEWTLRAGYSIGDQPVGKQAVLFNIVSLGVIEQHFTFGFSRRLQADREFNAAFMYAPENHLKGTNPFDPTQSVRLQMRQFEIEFGYSW